MRNAIFYPADCNARGPMAPNWKTHMDLFNWCINCTGFRGRQFIDKNAISSELKHFVEDMNFKFLIEMPRCQEPRRRARLCNTKIQKLLEKFIFLAQFFLLHLMKTKI